MAKLTVKEMAELKSLRDKGTQGEWHMCRQEDAEAIIKAYGFDRKANAIEHAWTAHPNPEQPASIGEGL